MTRLDQTRADEGRRRCHCRDAALCNGAVRRYGTFQIRLKRRVDHNRRDELNGCIEVAT